MDTTPNKRRNKPLLSVYLGTPEIAQKRLVALDGLADSLGVSRSELIQMVADGKLLLVVSPPSAPASSLNG